MSSIDEYASRVPSDTAPSGYVWAVTPSDTEDLPRVTRSIRVGFGGVVRLVPLKMTSPVDCVFRTGETRRIRATRIYSTGTTAIDIEGMA